MGGSAPASSEGSCVAADGTGSLCSSVLDACHDEATPAGPAAAIATSSASRTATMRDNARHNIAPACQRAHDLVKTAAERAVIYPTRSVATHFRVLLP